MNGRIIAMLGVALVLALLAGCAPKVGAPEGEEGMEGLDLKPAGFWKGLWHGFIMLFTFIVSLFKDDWGIYEANNTGNLYNLGYVLGAMIFFSGCGGGACKSKG